MGVLSANCRETTALARASVLHSRTWSDSSRAADKQLVIFGVPHFSELDALERDASSRSASEIGVEGLCAGLIPKQATAVWVFCSSPSYLQFVRKLDQKLNVTNATLFKVPFDLAHWQKVAAEKYPHGLPKPFSSDPTQWLFNGHPKGADQPLHVAVARLLGYQWPRQTGSSFPDCPALGPDGLEKLADDDGIVCLRPPPRAKRPAAERLRELLARAYGKDWNATAAGGTARPGGLRRRDAGRLAAQRVLRAALRALPPSPVHLAHLGRPQERLQRAGELSQARPRQSGEAHLRLPRRLDPPPAGRRGRRRGRQRRPPAGRQAIAGHASSSSSKASRPTTSSSAGSRSPSKPSAGTPTSTTACA